MQEMRVVQGGQLVIVAPHNPLHILLHPSVKWITREVKTVGVEARGV
jgi:hypothetical protein